MPLNICTKCPLHKEGCKTNCMPGRGEQNGIMFIGEAPGAEEDRLGLPFVGKAGKILQYAIEDCNLDEYPIYITNVVRCRPKNNRTPTLQESRTCVENHLIEEVVRVAPKLIVTLGNTALQALVGKRNIMKEAGKIVYSKFFPDIPIIPNIHPASLLYSHGQEWGSKLLFTEIMKYAKKFMKDGAKGKTGPEIELSLVVPENQEVAFDVEATGLDVNRETVTLVGCSIVWRKNGKMYGLVFSLPEEINNVYDILKKQKLIIGHNLKFDLRCLGRFIDFKKIREDLKGKLFCTMTTFGLLEPGYSSLKLEHLSRTKLGIFEKHKEENIYAEIAKGIWSTKAQNLCLRDSAVSLMLYEHIRNAYKDDYNSPLVKWVCNDVLITLAIQESRGIHIDKVELRRQESAIKLRAEHHEAVLKRYIENPNSTVQVGDYIKSKLPESKLSLMEVTEKTNRISLDEESRERLLKILKGDKKYSEVYRVLVRYNRWKKLTKKLSTYIKRLKEYAPIARPNTYPVGGYYSGNKTGGSVTGRITTELFTTFPRKGILKNIIIPIKPDDDIIVKADYKQAELFAAAVITNDENMISRIANGEDLHLTLACEIFNKTKNRITDDERQIAKRTNFATLYEVTPEGLKYQIEKLHGITIADSVARNAIITFYNNYPLVRKYQTSIHNKVNTQGIVRSPTGRVLYTNDVRKAVNMPIQSFSSDINTIAMCLLEEAGFHTLFSIYDSIIISTNKELFGSLENTIDKVKEIMTIGVTRKLKEIFGIDVPITPSVDVGWNGYWS